MCRPAITLSEAMSQDQLARLLMLIVDTEFNHDHLSWGGPWSQHAITCLLQDMLEGERANDCLSGYIAQTLIPTHTNAFSHMQINHDHFGKEYEIIDLDV